MQLLLCCLMLVLETEIRISKVKARGTTFDKCQINAYADDAFVMGRIF
jgi:hypothetical protein